MAVGRGLVGVWSGFGRGLVGVWKGSCRGFRNGMGRVGGRIFNGYRKNLNPFNFLVGVRQGFDSGLVWVW